MAVAVSIVVPCFNSERFVGQAVASALGQSDDLEVIVVDDGSTDGSAAIVSAIAGRDGRVRLLSGPNRGLSNARNTGLRAISPGSRFVLFLDADDVLASGAIRVLQCRLEREPELCAVFGARSRIDSGGLVIEPAPVRIPAYYAEDRGVRKVDLGDRIGYWHILPMCPISTPGQCLLRVSSVPPDDAFDERYTHSEDWDLWLRLARLCPIGVEHQEVLSYREHESNWSKDYGAMHRQRAAIFGAQVEVVAPEEVARFRAAWRFGLFKLDAGLCLRWAWRRLAKRDMVGAARYLQRALRWEVKYLWALARGRPRC